MLSTMASSASFWPESAIRSLKWPPLIYCRPGFLKGRHHSSSTDLARMPTPVVATPRGQRLDALLPCQRRLRTKQFQDGGDTGAVPALHDWRVGAGRHRACPPCCGRGCARAAKMRSEPCGSEHAVMRVRCAGSMRQQRTMMSMSASSS